MDHLDIHHDKQLLSAAHKFIGRVHAILSGVRTEHQKAMLNTWQQPSWVKHKTYDKTLGKLVLSNKTVTKMKVKGGPS
jgi:hypothetical protein